MLFPTLSFAAFFAIVLPVSWLLMPHRVRWRVFMVAASWFFYGAADWRFVPLLVGSTVANQFFARTIHRSSGATRKTWTVVAVASNLAVLGWFKYVGFLSLTLQTTLRDAGIHAHVPLPEVVLPIGISFFTFQALSYVIDTSRRRIEPSPLLDFAVYLSFFPHLIAGPIVRASEFLPQIREKIDPRKVDATRAFWLISLGLFKKVVISSYLGTYAADPLFGYPHQHAGIEALFGVYAYAVQIYMDFSGYTDIAIGLALLLGIKFPQNFNAPYAASSLQDFWRRWHMTLSRWLRDYLYIPLGGNRRGRVRTYVNLMITMLLGGLWHGAAWTFVAWGALHGIGLCVERLWHRDAPKEAPPTPVAPAPSTPRRVEVAAARRPAVVHAASSEAAVTSRVATMERPPGGSTAQWWVNRPTKASAPVAPAAAAPATFAPPGWTPTPAAPAAATPAASGPVPVPRSAAAGAVSGPPPVPRSAAAGAVSRTRAAASARAGATARAMVTGRTATTSGAAPTPAAVASGSPGAPAASTPYPPLISSLRAASARPASPRPAAPAAWSPPLPVTPWRPRTAKPAERTGPSISDWRPRRTVAAGSPAPPPLPTAARARRPADPAAAVPLVRRPADPAAAAPAPPLVPPSPALAPDAPPSDAPPSDAPPPLAAPAEPASFVSPASAEAASGNGRPAASRPSFLSPVARRWIGWFITFHIVCFAWIFFRATSFHNAVEVIGRIGDLNGLHQPFNWKAAAIVVAALAMQLGPRGGGAKLQAMFSRWPLWGQALILAGVLTVIDLMGPAGVAPFIYFRF